MRLYDFSWLASAQKQKANVFKVFLLRILSVCYGFVYFIFSLAFRMEWNDIQVSKEIGFWIEYNYMQRRVCVCVPSVVCINVWVSDYHTRFTHFIFHIHFFFVHFQRFSVGKLISTQFTVNFWRWLKSETHRDGCCELGILTMENGSEYRRYIKL